jgi:hypothetical protein
MYCEKCKGKLSVVSTRSGDDRQTPSKYSFIVGSFTYRSLACTECGYKSNSLEVSESEILKLKKICDVKLFVNELKKSLDKI